MSFQAFMNKDRKDKRNQEVEMIVSKSFKDESGRPVPFKIRPISFNAFSDLREKYSKIEIIENHMKKKVPMKKTNEGALTMELCAKCIVYPNLKNAELQNFYGVVTEVDLVDAMLTMQEMTAISDKIMEISGITEDINEVKEEAKN